MKQEQAGIKDRELKNEGVNLFLKLLMAVLFMTGAVIFSYPFVSNAINSYYDQRMMAKNMAEMAEVNARRQEEIYLEMQERNRELIANKNISNIPGMGLIEDPFDEAVRDVQDPGKEYYEDHNIGAIYIPAINVSLALFDETNSILLERGASVLQGTSFPIGGENTHSVISAHSGLSSRKLFTDLERIGIGDQFYLDVAGEKLAYLVDDIQTVLPTDIDKLLIQDGRDIVTLLTCTPYAINTHRLLVTGHRITYEEPLMEDQIAHTQKQVEQRFALYLFLIPVFFVSILYWMYRKYVFYQSGKRSYDFSFYLLCHGQPLEGVNFVLVKKRWLKADLESSPEARSDETGLLSFRNVRGGKYLAKTTDLKLPLIKGHVRRLKDESFCLKGGLRLRAVKDKYRSADKTQIKYYFDIGEKSSLKN